MGKNRKSLGGENKDLMMEILGEHSFTNSCSAGGSLAVVEVFLLWRYLLVNHVVFTVRKHRKAKCRENSHKDNLKITLCVTWRGSIKGTVLFGAIARRRVHRKLIKKGVNQKVSVYKKKISFYSFKPEVILFVWCYNSFTLQAMVRINLFCLGQKCSDLYKFKFSSVFPFKLSNLKIFRCAYKERSILLI